MFEMSQRDEISRNISESLSTFLAINRSVTKFRTAFRTEFRRDAEISKDDKTTAQQNFAHEGVKIRWQTKIFDEILRMSVSLLLIGTVDAKKAKRKDIKLCFSKLFLDQLFGSNEMNIDPIPLLTQCSIAWFIWKRAVDVWNHFENNLYHFPVGFPCWFFCTQFQLCNSLSTHTCGILRASRSIPAGRALLPVGNTVMQHSRDQ